ncbi:zinc ribbon domain-containing protein [Spirulina subsalsa]|uniref:zinc ribbon domain-containing protein n=1 Tax=Spirulina subsalsa TaxID=54311 RepID=UPI00035C75A7
MAEENRRRFVRTRASIQAKRTKGAKRLLRRLSWKESRFQAWVNVILVDPRYRSQTCARCHHIHPERGKFYRKGKVFKCGHCGFEIDAD